MATAKREGGLYYTEKGVAVDAEGREIKGAPKPSPDTPPEKQPGAIATTPEERMGLAIANALRGTTTAGSRERTARTESSEPSAEDEGEDLPKLADLPGHLAGLKTAEEVEALQKTDTRKGAVELYEARLAELNQK